MKTVLLALSLIVLPPFTCAATETNGFLVFEIERFSYTQCVKGGSQFKQSVKVPLTEEFLSQFKKMPSQDSMGTGFYCGGHDPKAPYDKTGFTWWIRRTSDNRWAINMWAMGSETINGVTVHNGNPSTTQYVTIKRWPDLDMRYQVSYVRKESGINVSFTAKYVSASAVEVLNSIPLAPVRKSDRSDLFKGDDQTGLPLKMNAGFQED